jgi:hypothetical protein
LHPPRPTVREDNDLLSWVSVSDAPGDRVGPLTATLCGWADPGQLDGWAGAAFLRMASPRCEAEDPNKDERPCQLFRCNTGHASRIAMSRVVPCEHVRPQTVSADDTVVGHSEQTQWTLLWGNLKADFMIQFPARTVWGFVSGPSSSTSLITQLRQSQQHPDRPPVRSLDANTYEEPVLPNLFNSRKLYGINESFRRMPGPSPRDRNAALHRA